jgi:hypothetical protein
MTILRADVELDDQRASRRRVAAILGGPLSLRSVALRGSSASRSIAARTRLLNLRVEPFEVSVGATFELDRPRLRRHAPCLHMICVGDTRRARGAVGLDPRRAPANQQRSRARRPRVRRGRRRSPDPHGAARCSAERRRPPARESSSTSLCRRSLVVTRPDSIRRSLRLHAPGPGDGSSEQIVSKSAVCDTPLEHDRAFSVHWRFAVPKRLPKSTARSSLPAESSETIARHGRRQGPDRAASIGCEPADRLRARINHRARPRATARCLPGRLLARGAVGRRPGGCLTGELVAASGLRHPAALGEL